jgi:hypothetical protein
MTNAIIECSLSLAINIVSVTYDPGAASSAHSHPCRSSVTSWKALFAHR